MPLISNKVGDPTLAEDLTSTVFLKALRWLREDQSADSARGWLYATARSTIIGYWQAQSQYEMHSLSGLEEQLLRPRAKQVIFLAGEEMKRQGEQSIRPMHLLLGLMHEGEGIGAGLLRTLGISLLQVRTALLPPEASQICSFCGRSGEEVARLFPAEIGIAERSAPSSSTFICDSCVKRFHTMLGTA